MQQGQLVGRGLEGLAQEDGTMKRNIDRSMIDRDEHTMKYQVEQHNRSEGFDGNLTGRRAPPYARNKGPASWQGEKIDPRELDDPDSLRGSETASEAGGPGRLCGSRRITGRPVPNLEYESNHFQRVLDQRTSCRSL